MDGVAYWPLVRRSVWLHVLAWIPALRQVMALAARAMRTYPDASVPHFDRRDGLYARASTPPAGVASTRPASNTASWDRPTGIRSLTSIRESGRRGRRQQTLVAESLAPAIRAVSHHWESTLTRWPCGRRSRRGRRSVHYRGLHRICHRFFRRRDRIRKPVDARRRDGLGGDATGARLSSTRCTRAKRPNTTRARPGHWAGIR